MLLPRCRVVKCYHVPTSVRTPPTHTRLPRVQCLGSHCGSCSRLRARSSRGGHSEGHHAHARVCASLCWFCAMASDRNFLSLAIWSGTLSSVHHLGTLRHGGTAWRAFCRGARPAWAAAHVRVASARWREWLSKHACNERPRKPNRRERGRVLWAKGRAALRHSQRDVLVPPCDGPRIYTSATSVLVRPPGILGCHRAYLRGRT